MVTSRRELLNSARLAVRDQDYKHARALLAEVPAASGTATEALAAAELDRCAAILLRQPPVSEVHGRCNPDDPASDEVYYFRAYRFYLMADVASAEAIVNKHAPLTSYFKIAMPLLRGWLCAWRGDLGEQLELAMGSLRALLSQAHPDPYLVRNAGQTVATLAREMPCPRARDLIEELLAHVEDPCDPTVVYHGRRALAVIDALSGQYASALAHLTHASQAPLDAVQQAWLSFDYAQVAQWAAQPVAALAAFRVGYETLLGAELNLVDRTDEAAFVLTAGAIAGASLDRAAARHLAHRASREVPSMASRWRLSGGARTPAILTEASVLTEGTYTMPAAIEAVDVFERLGYRWRAGRLAQRLYEQTGIAAFATRAQQLLECFERGPFAQREAAQLASLPPRQREILTLLQAGRSPVEISEQLDIALTTVRKHISALHRRSGARNRTQLLAMAAAAS
jgi:DNA-binding CsgD family transcriptional regulator